MFEDFGQDKKHADLSKYAEHSRYIDEITKKVNGKFKDEVKKYNNH